MVQREGQSAELPTGDSGVAANDRRVGELTTPGRQPNGHELTRRQVLVGLGAGGLALAVPGAVAYIIDRVSEVQKAQHTFDGWLSDVLETYPSDEEMSAMALACGDAFIDLDLEQHAAGIEGPLDVDEHILGTSNNFGNGFDSSSHDPYNQPNSLGQIGFGAINERARREMGLRLLRAPTRGRPGSYSGLGNYPGTTVGAADALLGPGQLRDPDFQRHIRTSEAIQIVRIEGGYDDYRTMFATVNQLAGRLTDVLRLAGGGSLNDDVRNGLNEFLAGVRVEASNFGAHLIEAAGLLNDANGEREANRLARLHGLFAFTWPLHRQGRFPFGPLVEGGDMGAIGRYLHVDQTGPPNLNRHYLDLDALPGGIGRKLARIAWAEIFLAQVAALHEIKNRYPRLHRAVEDLSDVNLKPNFYAARVPYGDPDGAVDAQGGGHPGMANGVVAGIQQLSLHNMQAMHRRGQRTEATFGAYAAAVLLAA